MRCFKVANAAPVADVASGRPPTGMWRRRPPRQRRDGGASRSDGAPPGQPRRPRARPSPSPPRRHRHSPPLVGATPCRWRQRSHDGRTRARGTPPHPPAARPDRAHAPRAAHRRCRGGCDRHAQLPPRRLEGRSTGWLGGGCAPDRADRRLPVRASAAGADTDAGGGRPPEGCSGARAPRRGAHTSRGACRRGRTSQSQPVTAVLPTIPHSNSCKRVPNRPLRPRREARKSQPWLSGDLPPRRVGVWEGGMGDAIG